MNSIFKKLFLFYMIALGVSLIIITMALTKAFNLYFESQKKDVLIEQGEKIVHALEQSYYWGGFFDKEQLDKEIKILDEFPGEQRIGDDYLTRYSDISTYTVNIKEPLVKVSFD